MNGGSEPKKVDIKKLILRMALGACVGIAVSVAIQKWLKGKDEEAVSTAVYNEMENFKAKAEALHPGEAPMAALHEESIKRSEDMLSGKTGEEKAQNAADQFLGFYLMNTRIRADYCKALGVDISPFVNAFAMEHYKLHEKMQAIHARKTPQLTADEVEGQLYTLLLPTSQKMVSDDMAALANKNNISETRACSVIASKGFAVASAMNVSKLNPALYYALSGAQ